jgi:hypothetical protein
MNTVAPISPVERHYRQIGDLAKCAWCGERAKSAFEIYNPAGWCFVSAHAGGKPTAPRRQRSEAELARFSVWSTRRSKRRVGEVWAAGRHAAARRHHAWQSAVMNFDRSSFGAADSTPRLGLGWIFCANRLLERASFS